MKLRLLIALAATVVYCGAVWPQASGRIRVPGSRAAETGRTAGSDQAGVQGSAGVSGEIRIPGVRAPAVESRPVSGGVVLPALVTVQAPARRNLDIPPLDLDMNAPQQQDDVKDVPVLIEADSEAILSSQMAARVKKVHYGIGQSFRKGAVLIDFDCSEQQAKLQSVQAEYLGAQATHVAKLKLQGLGAASELEVTLAAAAAEKAKSAVRQQDALMQYCRITAPYSGKVARVRIKAFENVTIGQPLLDIVDQSKLKAVMHVPSTWLSWLKPGTPVNIKLAETGREHYGRVSKLNARVDAVSQSIEIEATLDAKDAKILPGMIGTATFPGHVGGGSKLGL